MTLRRSAIAGAVFGMIAGASWLAFARPMNPPPPSWVECAAYGTAGCSTGGDDTISWAENETELRLLWAWVGRSIIFREEPEGADEWLDFPLPGYWAGDCEDFALTLRRIAIERGIPADALRPLALWNGHGFHAALLVYTHDAGVKVFDVDSFWACRLNACADAPPPVYDFNDYIAAGRLPLYVYEPGGSWRFTEEYYGEPGEQQP